MNYVTLSNGVKMPQLGYYEKGEVNATPAVEEAYQMGKQV